MEKIALGLGTNHGDRCGALRAAVEALTTYMSVSAVSPVYETAALYVADQPPFLNAALVGETKLTALALLWNLKRLETELGRVPTFRYGPRAIDLDLLFYGGQSMSSHELTVPHAHMAEREFVLRPLADIAPDWCHPRTGLTVAEMLGRIRTDNPRCLGPLL
ncbi:MAG: 2-amino-4-hydroxy-6-hydroxymethyldihydropteridine diphosphokinase [Pseudomonadota bacterium]|nr:2-amino-4-hydroxy-6-hydroxymethyldihydropteridine diphosphokinase [Pseudomonadota bacterium]